MINFTKQFEKIELKFKEIEDNLNNQSDLDTEQLVKLNKEYAELTPIVEAIKKYKDQKDEINELSKLIEDDDISGGEILSDIYMNTINQIFLFLQLSKI